MVSERKKTRELPDDPGTIAKGYRKIQKPKIRKLASLMDGDA